MGRLVVDRLVADGHSVRVFDLPVANFDGLDVMAGVEIATGDLTDAGDVAAAVAGASAIVHLAAILPPVAEANPELTDRVNVEGTRVLLEAASMGLPLVTTDLPGCRAVVEDGLNGFLIPACDIDALSKAILRLIEHAALRHIFGRVSRQRAIQHFDLSVIAGRTRDLYRQLMASKGYASMLRDSQS